ncbi:MAG: FtsQ-type POTRA domain-containing protein [Kofleriaceae bacterium]|nr:FtsQ-type POTRA domain-containing protein [Kofleriaceae bacterium]
MDRSQRAGAGKTRSRPPSTSRLTVKARPNRRKPGTLWSRLPKPAAIGSVCGRVLRRSVPALVGASVLAAVGGTAWAGYRFVTTSERFAITTIEINGNHVLSDEQITAALPARIGDNVFSIDLDNLVGDLRGNPWVARAEARRVLPHTIVVDIREHVPSAIAQLGGLYLVDEQGHPFKRAELGGGDGAGLPIVTGLDRASYVANPDAVAGQIRGALDALDAWRSSSERPSVGEVHLDSHGALTLVTYEHAISIQLGAIDSGLAGRMQTFDATWAELSDPERTRTRAIHLDARSDQVTVAFAKAQ